MENLIFHLVEQKKNPTLLPQFFDRSTHTHLNCSQCQKSKYHNRTCRQMWGPAKFSHSILDFHHPQHSMSCIQYPVTKKCFQFPYDLFSKYMLCIFDFVSKYIFVSANFYKYLYFDRTIGWTVDSRSRRSRRYDKRINDGDLCNLKSRTRFIWINPSDLIDEMHIHINSSDGFSVSWLQLWKDVAFKHLKRMNRNLYFSNADKTRLQNVAHRCCCCC